MSPKEIVVQARERQVAETNGPPKSGIDFSRSEDFTELYANHVGLEGSLWDLKLVFGQTSQNISPNAVVQHTAVTLPWAQVKVLLYALTLAMIDQEAGNGRIRLKKGLIAEFPQQMPKAIREAGEVSEETWKALRKVYDQLIADNPELVGK